MRLASFQLPKKDNYGNDLAHIHDRVIDELCDTFGGFTRRETQSGWVDDNNHLFLDNNFEYSVTIESDGVHLLKFRHIVLQAGYDAKQKAMFTVYPDGICHILKIQD